MPEKYAFPLCDLQSFFFFQRSTMNIWLKQSRERNYGIFIKIILFQPLLISVFLPYVTKQASKYIVYLSNFHIWDHILLISGISSFNFGRWGLNVFGILTCSFLFSAKKQRTSLFNKSSVSVNTKFIISYLYLY